MITLRPIHIFRFGHKFTKWVNSCRGPIHSPDSLHISTVTVGFLSRPNRLSSVILWFFVWSSHLSPSACPRHNTFSWKLNMPIVQAGGSLRPPELNPNREEKLIMHCTLQFTVCYTGTEKHKNHIKESGAQQIIIIIRSSLFDDLTSDIYRHLS